MRRGAIVVGISLVFMALTPLASYNVSAAAENQLLWAEGMLSYDQELYGNGTGADALNRVNRTPTLWSDADTGDDNYFDKEPGCWLWGDYESATEGTFGTAEMRFTLSDLIGETSSYYDIAISARHAFTLGPPEDEATTKIDTEDGSTYYLSFRVGFGYVDADTGTAEFINETYINASNIADLHLAAPDGLQQNDPFDRPFTASEVDHMYFILQMRFEPQGVGNLELDTPTPINLALAYIMILAVVADYTPTEPQTGRFILRPNADTYSNGFANYSVDDYEGMYGALNETPRHGDAEQSFINGTWDKAAFVGLGFTDPPEWAPDIDYRVTLWSIIRQTVVTSGTYYTLTMSISSEGYDQKAYYPSVSYTNNTHDSDFIPGSSLYWSLTDLQDIMANLWLGWVGSTPDGEMRITQVAFLVTPVVPGDYVPPAGDYEFEDVLEFLGPGNGFSILFAVIGGIGLIATAPLMIIFYKDGREDGIGAVALGVCWATASLGFLIIGTNAWA